MSYERHSVTITTAADGTGTGYIAPDGQVTPSGELCEVIYVKDGTNPYADTLDITVTTETTNQQIWAKSNVTVTTAARPCLVAQNTDGTDNEAVVRFIICGERVKIAIKEGGASNVGAFHVTFKTA